MDWKKLWENKGKSYCEEDEISANGFDSHGSKISDFTHFRNKVCETIIKKSKFHSFGKILEIGCGDGSLLNLLSSNFKGAKFHGIDYSEGLINAASEKFIHIDFKNCSADKLPFENETFDLVYCFSVFQYFDNLEFAKKVVNECLRVLKNTHNLLILDVTDQSKKELAELARRIPSEHLYYEKAFFKNNFKNVEIFENFIPEYENSKFRFNVSLEKGTK